MLSEEEKEAIEFIKFYQQHCLKKEKENMKQYETVNDEEFVSKNLDTVLNLITKLQKENKEKDKIIYEIARSNVKLKGYEIEEKYIDTTIRFFTKYVKNLERNPQWRNDKNE